MPGLKRLGLVVQLGAIASDVGEAVLAHRSDCTGSIFRRRQIASDRARTTFIVFPLPGLNLHLGVGYLRDLAKRSERGEFSLGPMLIALLKTNGEGVPRRAQCEPFAEISRHFCLVQQLQSPEARNCQPFFWFILHKLQWLIGLDGNLIDAFYISLRIDERPAERFPPQSAAANTATACARELSPGSVPDVRT